MIAVWIALGLALGVIGLGHLRLRDRQADVAAARRRLEALWQQRAQITDDAGYAKQRRALDARIVAIHRIHEAELRRYRQTTGARINLWRPKALPPGLDEVVAMTGESRLIG